jgi:hypothetical protein
MATVGTTPRPAYVYDQETDTWVPVGVGPHTHDTFIPNTIIDAKGDLIAGSAPDTVGKLSIGANSTFLVADSTETLGMAWRNTITIASGTTVPLTIQNNGTGNSFVVNDEASDTTAFVIDPSGNVGIGTSSPGQPLHIDSASFGIRVRRYSATTFAGAGIDLQKSASGTVGTNTVVASGDRLGRVTWSGFDGTNYITPMEIAVDVTGAVSTGIMPTQMAINSLNSSGSLVERMRIDSSGNVGIGTAPSYPLDVRASTAQINATSTTGTNFARLLVQNTGGSFQIGLDSSTGSNYGMGGYSRVFWNDGAYPLVFTTSSLERMRIDSAGKMSLSAIARDTTSQVRNITLSTSAPSSGNDGDVWIQYTA